MDKSLTQEQLQKFLRDHSDTQQIINEKLSNAHCIIEQNDVVVYMNPLKKEDDCFYARIECLEPGENYTVYLFGKYDLSYYILTSARQSGVRIIEGKDTGVHLSWSPFVAITNAPAFGDTVTGRRINLDWNPVIGANEYHLMVDDDNRFYSPIIDTKQNYSQASISSGSFQEGGIYFWKVQCIGTWVAKRRGGEGYLPGNYLQQREGPWSKISSFVLMD
jgi:hypothetical protein